MHTRGSREAYEEKQRKQFVGQRLGVTPNRWLTPKHWLLIWNFVVFCYYVWIHQKKKKKEQPAFRCQPAFGVTPNRWPTNFFFLFLHEPYVSLLYAWSKMYFFHHFMFLIVFNHANAWASMSSLVEIHNKGFFLILNCESQYSNHLNTGLVWYWNGRFVSGCQMVWYLNGGLKK